MTETPTNAQARALGYLVEATPHGAEMWHDALQVEREITWLACERRGWVRLDRSFGRIPCRVLITDAGREVR